jgi:hypothetical protein
MVERLEPGVEEPPAAAARRGAVPPPAARHYCLENGIRVGLAASCLEMGGGMRSAGSRMKAIRPRPDGGVRGGLLGCGA